MQGRVTVYGPDILRPPLCDDTSARIVVIRDKAGAPLMFLVRLGDDVWGISTPDDDDWGAMCLRFGINTQPLGG